MDRREFLAGARKKKQAVAAASRNISSGIAPYAGPCLARHELLMLNGEMIDICPTILPPPEGPSEVAPQVGEGRRP